MGGKLPPRAQWTRGLEAEERANLELPMEAEGAEKEGTEVQL